MLDNRLNIESIEEYDVDGPLEIDGVKFDINYEALTRGIGKELIERLVVDKTPSVVLKMLSYYECTIKFRSAEYFTEKGKGEDVIGFFEPMSEIVVRSDINFKYLVGTIHHEIGHFVDSVISKYMIGYGENVIINGSSGKWMLDAMDRDSHIFKRNYYRDSEKEFFAQSYANYVMESAIMDKAERTKQVLEQYMYDLSALDIAIGEDIVGLELVWKINDEVYMGTPYNDKRVNFYLKESGYMISFKDVKCYKLNKYGFMNEGEYLLAVFTEYGVKRYIIKQDCIVRIDYIIADIYDEYLSSNKNIAVIKRMRGYDFIKNVDGCYIETSYSFEDIIPINTDKGVIFLCIGAGELKFMDINLNVLKSIKGEYSFDIEREEKDGSTRLFFFKDEGRVNIYNERGEYSGYCLNANEFGMYNNGKIEKYLFIKYEKKSVLINLDKNILIKNDWDEINICMHTNRYILGDEAIELSRECGEDLLRMKKDGVWYLGKITNGKIEVLFDDYVLEECEVMIYKQKNKESLYIIGVLFGGEFEKTLFVNDESEVIVEVLEISLDNGFMNKVFDETIPYISLLEMMDEIYLIDYMNYIEDEEWM